MRSVEVGPSWIIWFCLASFPAVAGTPDHEIVESLLEKDKLERAVRKCDGLRAHDADADPPLREACAEAERRSMVPDSGVDVWLALAARWRGTRAAHAARDVAAKLALDAMPPTANSAAWAQAAQRFEGTTSHDAFVQGLETAAFREAGQTGTSEGWKAFRESFPASRYQDEALGNEARASLAELDATSATYRTWLEASERFKTTELAGAFVERARAAAMEEAEHEGTSHAWRDLVWRFPDQLLDAAQRVARLERERADASCAAGGPAACVEMGEQLVDGRHGARDLERGVRLLADACDAGEIRACGAWAEAATGDEAKRVGLAIEACRRGVDRGCVALAEVRDFSDELPDPRELFHQACDNGAIRACFGLTFPPAPWEERLTPTRLLVEIAGPGCREGDRDSCALLLNTSTLHNYLGEAAPATVGEGLELVLRKIRDGGERGWGSLAFLDDDLRAALPDRQRAVDQVVLADLLGCFGGSIQACDQAAAALPASGWADDLAVNPAVHALELGARYCDLGDASACVDLAVKTADGRNPRGSDQDAIRLFRRGAELGSAGARAKMAEGFEYGLLVGTSHEEGITILDSVFAEGDAVLARAALVGAAHRGLLPGEERDPWVVRWEALAESGCTRGDTETCEVWRASVLSKTFREHTSAERWSVEEAACVGGVATACIKLASRWLGAWFEDNPSPDPMPMGWAYKEVGGGGMNPMYQPRKAVHFLELACERGDADACRRAGEMLWIGLSVERSADKASELLAKACRTAGDEISCARAAQMADPRRARAIPHLQCPGPRTAYWELYGSLFDDIAVRQFCMASRRGMLVSDGPTTIHRWDGTTVVEKWYESNQRAGTWRYYDESGRLTREVEHGR